MKESNAEDSQAISDIRERTRQAENTGDADFFDANCTDDVVMMPPNLPEVSGRGPTVAFMRGFFSQFELNVQYVNKEIQVHGDIAFDRGKYSQTLTPKAGGGPTTESGKYLGLYSRSSDGSWKWARVIWNASEQPSGTNS
jgi:uncharacterized protein (TIGR02246 family)